MINITIRFVYTRTKVISTILMTCVEETTSTSSSARPCLEIVAFAASPNWDGGCLSSTSTSSHRTPYVRSVLLQMGRY